MRYAPVDPVIATWCNEHGLTLFTEFDGEERRFCYITGGAQECFQISVECPLDGKVMVNAHSIETIDDAELHRVWVAEVADLQHALLSAWRQVEVWKKRATGAATWTPPRNWNPSA